MSRLLRTTNRRLSVNRNIIEREPNSCSRQSESKASREGAWTNLVPRYPSHQVHRLLIGVPKMASPAPAPTPCSVSAYVNCDAMKFATATPLWLNKGDNAWQMTAATLVGMQSVPGLVILYGSIVKKKWAVNSAFMAFYAFAATLIVWVLWAYKMAFGDYLLPFWGRTGVALQHNFLLAQATVPASATHRNDSLYGTFQTSMAALYFPAATMVYFQFVFAAITVILVAGSLLGRMNFHAWILFVPLWVTFSYTVGAFSLFGGGFLAQLGVIDYSGGYVIHLSSGIAGFTAAYWVGPRLKSDRDSFPPNNLLLMLAGAGILWLGWTGFNGGDPLSANIDSSMAVLNTHICTATSLLVWLTLDTLYFGKPSVIGAVQGMVTGLVCITPAAGVIEGWAAIILGLCSGSIPWYTMMILHKRTVLIHIDDVMAVFHTHAVAGTLGGLLAGVFAEPTLSNLFSPVLFEHGLFYIWHHHGGVRRGAYQMLMQIVGALFIIAWNVVVTTIICLVIKLVVPLRLSDEQLLVGDDAVHGEEAYALFGDGSHLSTDHSQSTKSYYNENEDPKGLPSGTELNRVPKGTTDPAFSP